MPRIGFSTNPRLLQTILLKCNFSLAILDSLVYVNSLKSFFIQSPIGPVLFFLLVLLLLFDHILSLHCFFKLS